jgi:exodeoxyribonuclease-3
MVVMRLRVVTYNIKDGGLGREGLILQVLKAARPDVVVLEEVYEATLISQWAEALEMSFFRARGNTRRHLALLSRFPIESSASFHPNPPIQTTLLEATLRLAPKRSVRIFGVHLLAQPFIAMELWRVWEVAAILRRVNAIPDDLSLIVGDFNAIAPNDSVTTAAWPLGLKFMLGLQGGHVFRAAVRRVLATGFFDCYRELHKDDAGFTLPVSAPNARLDYVFASGDLRRGLLACQVIREPAAVMTASDHCPLLAEFEL